MNSLKETALDNNGSTISRVVVMVMMVVILIGVPIVEYCQYTPPQIVSEETGVVVGCTTPCYGSRVGHLILLLDDNTKWEDENYKGSLFAIGDIIKVINYDNGVSNYLLLGRREIFL